MTGWALVGLALVMALAGCRRAPRAVYEYEPPVTFTSTDRPVPPPASARAAGPTSTTMPPRAPVWLRGGTR